MIGMEPLYLPERRALTIVPEWTSVEGSPFERAVLFEPGFARDPDEPAKPRSEWLGRGAAKFRFLLRGQRGVAQFLFGTGWTPELEAGEYGPELMHQAPTGWDVGYHAEARQYTGQDSSSCELTHSGQCFYGGSSLAADDLLARLMRGGMDVVWAELERVHDQLEVSS